MTGVQTCALPISLLEDDTINIPPTKAETRQPNQKEDPFSDEGISKAPKKFILAASKPPGPPSDDSSSESLNPNQPNRLFLLDPTNDPLLPPLPLILNQSVTTLI